MVGECRGIFVQKRSECPARARAAGAFAPPETSPGDRGQGRAEQYQVMPNNAGERRLRAARRYGLPGCMTPAKRGLRNGQRAQRSLVNSYSRELRMSSWRGVRVRGP